MNRISAKGIKLAAAVLVAIAVAEGYVRDAMIPVPGDVPTVGFGSTKDVRMGHCLLLWKRSPDWCRRTYPLTFTWLC